jgi:hypothetical protein
MGKDDEIKGLGDGWRSFLSWIDMVEFTQNRYGRKWVKGVFVYLPRKVIVSRMVFSRMTISSRSDWCLI